MNTEREVAHPPAHLTTHLEAEPRAHRLSRGVRAVNALVAGIVLAFTLVAYLHGYSNIIKAVAAHGMAAPRNDDGWWEWLTGARTVPLMFDAFALACGLQALVWMHGGRVRDYRYAWRLMLVYSAALVLASASVAWKGWDSDPLELVYDAWPGVTTMVGWHVLLRRFERTSEEAQREPLWLRFAQALRRAERTAERTAGDVVDHLIDADRYAPPSAPVAEPDRTAAGAPAANRTGRRRRAPAGSSTVAQQVRRLLMSRGGADATAAAVNEVARRADCTAKYVREVRRALARERPRVVGQ